METWTPLIVAHAVAASLALFLGPINIFRRPKGDIPHRIIGFTWIAAMYFVSFSSFFIHELNPGSYSWIHLLSILTIVTITTGLIAAMRHNIALHKPNMIGSYLGLVGAFIGVVVVPERLIPQLFQHNPLGLLSLTVLILAAAYVLYIVAIIIGKRFYKKKNRGVY